MSTKWEMILIFSFIAGIAVVFPASVILSSMFGSGVREADFAKRSTFASWSEWAVALGKYLGKKALDGILLFILALAIGFVLLLVCTGGMPFDSTWSMGTSSK